MPTDLTAALRTALVELANAARVYANVVEERYNGRTGWASVAEARSMLLTAIEAALASQADDPSGRNRARSMGEDASGGYREIAGCGCEECERHRQADDPSGPDCGYECPFAESGHPDLAGHDFEAAER